MLNTVIPTTLHCWNLSTNGCKEWATGMCATVRKCYRARSRGPADSYAIYLLAMRSLNVPLEAVTAAFREYDFPYNEAVIRCLLRKDTPAYVHIYIYIQWQWPRVLSRPPVHTRGYNDSAWNLLVFIAMDTPPSSSSPPSLVSGSSRLDAWWLCAWGVTPCQRLATALATLLLLTPVLLLDVMDGQSQAWKHAVPLTVQDITDAGSPI